MVPNYCLEIRVRKRKETPLSGSTGSPRVGTLQDTCNIIDVPGLRQQFNTDDHSEVSCRPT